MPPQKRSISTGRDALHLSAEDVQRLLSPDEKGAARLSVAGKVADRYVEGGFGAAESVIAEQIFRLLVRDAELKVRVMMAEQLKSAAQVPKDIVVTLAHDAEDAVALPVLKHSEVLTEADLIDLVRATGSTARHVAVSGRREVPPRLAGALLEKEAPEVAQALVKNPGAQLSEEALGAIVERFSADGSVMNALADRSSLPLSVAEKVVSRVSEGVAQGLRRKYRLTEEDLHAAAERAREMATLELLRHNTTPYEMEKLVDQLADYERLTPSLVFTALCQGHVAFFELSMARLSGIPFANAQTLLNDRGDLGFRALYNKSGLPAGMFGAAKRVLSVVHEVLDAHDIKRGAECADRVAARLLQIAEAAPEENLNYLIALLRKGKRP